MTKLKKTYCILSLIFAIAVFVAVLFASQNRTTVYAASMDPDSIDSLDNTAANTSTGSGSESDSKGGLSISINNDEAGVASEVRALLLLTIIAVSPSLLIMLTSYTRIVIVLHILNGKEIVVGGSIIIPIDISTDATTISITINGIYIRNPIMNACLSSPIINDGIIIVIGIASYALCPDSSYSFSSAALSIS